MQKTNSSVIETNNLTKYYGKSRGIENINLSINKGEIFGIVGPDGAGKSTLLRLMASILIADSGTIHIKNINVAGNPFFIKEISDG